MDINYQNAYFEVLEVISNLKMEEYKKIDPKYIEFFKKNCNHSYFFEYDTTKKIEEQKLLEETKYILFLLFEKFGATRKQKDKIAQYQIFQKMQIEEEKRKKYGIDIFENKLIDTTVSDSRIQKNECNQLVEYKESFIKRFFRLLKIKLKKE